MSPPSIHAAFNPVKVMYLKESSDSVDEVLMYVKGVAFTRHFIGRTVTFYIDGELRKLFKEGTQNVFGGNDTRVVTDSLLAAPYEMRGDSPLPVNIMSRLALNAVVQVGESESFNAFAGKFLTKARYLQKYSGYPLSVAALTFGAFGSGEATYVFYNAISLEASGLPTDVAHVVIDVPEDIAFVRISTNSTCNALQCNSGELITTNGGQTIELFRQDATNTTDMQVVSECTPVSPFYVKWVNSMGGYGYFMFKRRQKVKQELKNVQVVAPFVQDVDAAKLNEEVYSYEVDNSVIAGAENINVYELEALRGLLVSPRIWWYREDLREWIRIYIAKGSTQEDTGQTMHSVEYEFTLPKQNVQI
jgi:hypothetical protein